MAAAAAGPGKHHWPLTSILGVCFTAKQLLDLLLAASCPLLSEKSSFFLPFRPQAQLQHSTSFLASSPHSAPSPSIPLLRQQVFTHHSFLLPQPASGSGVTFCLIFLPCFAPPLASCGCPAGQCGMTIETEEIWNGTPGDSMVLLWGVI